MKTPWATLAAWQASMVARHDDALRWAAEADRDLAAVLAQAAGRQGPPPGDARVANALAGWQAYYRGAYHEALDGFRAAVDASGEPDWPLAWAALGIAKVATDAMSWPCALAWCALASALARAGELTDLLAACAGARGEILLRSGDPLGAAQAFAEDLALLPPGSRYAGRVRCYLAHAWSRMGQHGQRAALVAYRLAAHTPGEEATRDHAAAGLALLGVRSGQPALVEEALSWQPRGLGACWCWVAKARLAAAPASALAQAWQHLPPPYRAERRWLRRWAASLGVALPAPAPDEETPPLALPSACDRWQCLGPVDAAPSLPPRSEPDDPWLARDAFMP